MQNTTTDRLASCATSLRAEAHQLETEGKHIEADAIMDLLAEEAFLASEEEEAANEINDILVGDSEPFFQAAHEMAKSVKRSKGNDGIWNLSFNGIELDLVRSEGRKNWELWSKDGDCIARDCKSHKTARYDLVWHARSLAQEAARLAAFDAANPEITY